jgi:hypothetical protein
MMTALQIEERPIGLYGLDDLEGSDQRLASLIRANELAQQDEHASGVQMMADPISKTRAFALLGMLLGGLGPFSIGFSWFFERAAPSGEELVFLTLFALANLTTAFVGYFTGKMVGNLVQLTHKFRLMAAAPLLMLIGMIWGCVSGFAGGLFLLLIGSVVGAVIGAIFGGIAMVLFGIPYRYLQAEGSIERHHFVPLALGTTLTLCAFVLAQN